jgi:hypothetical protein
MKRSEALSIILNKMSGYSNKEDAAESALKELEASGMLPPERVIEVKDIRLKTYTKLSYTWDKE